MKGAVIHPQFLLIVLVVEAVTAVLLWILPLPRISGAFKRGHPIVNRLAGRRGCVDRNAILSREGWGVVLTVKSCGRFTAGSFSVGSVERLEGGAPHIKQDRVCVCVLGGGGVNIETVFVNRWVGLPHGSLELSRESTPLLAS